MSDYLDLKWGRYYEEPELQETKKWFGVYKGVRFEINNFKTSYAGDCWTHYILLELDDQLPKELADKFWLKGEMRDKRIYYDYYVNPINQLQFHGGCTWYEKLTGFDGEHRSIKIGCDYQHYWDEDQDYDLDTVYEETKKTIDSLYDIEKNIKFWNSGDGVYRTIEEYKKEE